MAIRIVRLGSPRAPGEGLRLGTVRRPPRGVRKEDYAVRDYFDLWLPDVAPSAPLVSYAFAEPWTAKRWATYASRYRREMREPAAQRLLALLAVLSKHTDFAVGCYCEDESRCHRSLLRDLLIAHGAVVVPAAGVEPVSERRTSKTLSVSIECPAAQVYAFVANPENLPRWAAGLGRSVRKDGDRWIVDAPDGAVGFRFAESNAFGVLDHYVSPTPGVEVLNPMRVIRNGDDASEVLFTVFQRAGMRDEDFANDVGLVQRDLETLKTLLEARATA